ncbi:hypothetical protein MIR68_003105 [Amoeboaphelidium protococcarum]|nr:hypothetical protein MIR68_003105 [Amoeboaphelidium protococcarum]
MSTKCQVCEKTVYPMEMVKIDDLTLHKTCLRCAHCNNQLSLGKYAAINGKYYCKPHFKQLFALKGNYTSGFGENDTGASSSLGGVQFKGLNNNNNSNAGSESNPKPLANKKAASSNAMAKVGSTASVHDGSNDEIKAVSRVAEGIRASIENLKQTAAKSSSRSELHHQGSKLRISSANDLDYASGDGKNTQQSVRAKFNAQSSAASGGTTNKCAGCEKTVFPMEQIQVESIVYHKSCFRCAHCNNILKLGNYAALDSKHYCKPHFKQLFALKGNYNEGFGSRPHKEKWNPKDLSQSQSELEQAQEKTAPMQV